ncbi:hypothetical protein ACFL4V_01535 [Candidatus Latescibacterota bacterium]
MVIEEHRCFKEDDLGCIAEKNRKRLIIEREIENTNNFIVNLFSKSNIDSKDMEVESIEELSLFMNKLRESIKYTMNVVEETVASMEKEKDKTAIQLKTLNKNRNAISSYAIYGTI